MFVPDPNYACCSHCQYHNVDPKCLSQLKISLKKVEVKNTLVPSPRTFSTAPGAKTEHPQKAGPRGQEFWISERAEGPSVTGTEGGIPASPLPCLSLLYPKNHLYSPPSNATHISFNIYSHQTLRKSFQAKCSLLSDFSVSGTALLTPWNSHNHPQGWSLLSQFTEKETKAHWVDYFVPHFTTVNSRPSSLSKAVDLCLLSPLNPYCSSNKMNQTETAIGVISVSCKKNFPRASDVKHQNIWKGPDGIASGRLEWSILLFCGEWQLLSWKRLSWSYYF